MPSDETNSVVEAVNQDIHELENIGYEQELRRSFSLVSMIGFCFSILSCWAAISGTLTEAMENGGPAALVWGWLGVSIFSLFVAASMGEICSSYPVSGGQYSWVLLLGKGTKWGHGLSYITGCIQLAGLLCMGSTALYMIGQFIAGMAVLNSPAESFEKQSWQVALICWAMCTVSLCVNLFGNSIMRYISVAGLWVSLGGFLLITIVVLAVSEEKQTASFVFTAYIDDSGWNSLGMVVIMGILQSAYSMCCYDAPTHMCEELFHASRDAPRAIFLSVFIGFINGLAYIIAILFCITDLDKVADSVTGVPILEIFYQATNNKIGASCLQSLLMMCQVFASIALTAEGSRSVYAFARDGAFPQFLNEKFKAVHPSLDVPVWALIATSTSQAIFCAILYGSSTAFSTVLSVATIGLYVSYLIPILVTIFRRDHMLVGYYHMSKKVGITVNIVASLYLIFASVFFFFPTTLPVTGDNMNYAIVAFGIVAVIGTILWVSGGKNTYGELIEGHQLVERQSVLVGGEKNTTITDNSSNSV